MYRKHTILINKNKRSKYYRHICSVAVCYNDNYIVVDYANGKKVPYYSDNFSVLCGQYKLEARVKFNGKNCKVEFIGPYGYNIRDCDSGRLYFARPLELFMQNGGGVQYG